MLAAFASVADDDHHVGQGAVLLDGCDGSATGTIKVQHVNRTDQRERVTLVASTARRRQSVFRMEPPVNTQLIECLRTVNLGSL